MNHKPYSQYNTLPTGQASDNLTEGCLVLEGGAFRGLYTQGFLDELMLNDINLSCVIGVSAGALGGVNYVSGQIGRSARINIGYRHDSRYVGLKALRNSKSILDISFLTEDRGILEPLDMSRFMDSRRRFVAVATNCVTGKAEYFEKGRCNDIMNAVRASATMPFISPPVIIEGVPYLDGGCACKIPYEWALKEGYDKIIVIKTRDNMYRQKEKLSTLPLRLYKDYPRLAHNISSASIDYNNQCNALERLHRQGRLLRFAPSVKVTVGRVEKDLEKLGDLYYLGRDDCRRQLATIREYLYNEYRF